MAAVVGGGGLGGAKAGQANSKLWTQGVRIGTGQGCRLSPAQQETLVPSRLVQARISPTRTCWFQVSASVAVFNLSPSSPSRPGGCMPVGARGLRRSVSTPSGQTVETAIFYNGNTMGRSDRVHVFVCGRYLYPSRCIDLPPAKEHGLGCYPRRNTSSTHIQPPDNSQYLHEGMFTRRGMPI